MTVSPQNLADDAYRNLRDAILEGRLPPGAPLSRRRLAEQFGMSPVPVGDALTRLEAEGLVETRARAGSRVRIPAPSEIAGNYELREALETHSARLFAETASPAVRERLLAAAARLDAGFSILDRCPYDARRHARIERMHVAFHLLIARATGCSELVTAIERSRVLLFNWLFMLSAELAGLPPGWHTELAKALVSGKPEEAAEAMRTHVRYRRREVAEKLRELARRAAKQERMARGPQRRTGK